MLSNIGIPGLILILIIALIIFGPKNYRKWDVQWGTH